MDIRFVLVRPRNPLNIGASARAISNFGFNKLVVVNPYAPIWNEAQSAVGAVDVLKGAKKVGKFEEAVQGCQLVVGTSAGQRRKRDDRWIDVGNLGAIVSQNSNKKMKVALVFGQEKNGLTNEVLNQCHHVLTLPTNPWCPSMNLGQAVAVVAYQFNQWIRETSKN